MVQYYNLTYQIQVLKDIRKSSWLNLCRESAFAMKRTCDRDSR